MGRDVAISGNQLPAWLLSSSVLANVALQIVHYQLRLAVDSMTDEIFDQLSTWTMRTIQSTLHTKRKGQPLSPSTDVVTIVSLLRASDWLRQVYLDCKMWCELILSGWRILFPLHPASSCLALPCPWSHFHWLLGKKKRGQPHCLCPHNSIVGQSSSHPSQFCLLFLCCLFFFFQGSLSPVCWDEWLSSQFR